MLQSARIFRLSWQPIRTSILIGVALWSLPLSGSARLSLLDAKDLEPLPIRVGEILTYRVKIAGMSAGKQVATVVQQTVLDGHGVYHLTSESRTSSLFAKLYHFRDSKESYITTNQLYPVRFMKTLEDRSYQARVEVNFYCENGSAEYSNNEEDKEIQLPIGTQDELSMVYFVRSKDLQIGRPYAFPLLVKDTAQVVVLTPYRREMMKTAALGRVETTALRTSHGYLIWLTNDAHRIPVRIEAETRIGKLVGTLERVDFAE